MTFHSSSPLHMILPSIFMLDYNKYAESIIQIVHIETLKSCKVANTKSNGVAMNSVSSPQEQSHSFKNRSSNFPKFSSSFLFLSIILTSLIIIILKSLNTSSNIPFFPSPPRPAAGLLSNHAISMLRRSITFLPLKDLRLSDHPTDGNTWFMSSIPDSPSSQGEPAHIRFPSAAAGNRLLCISAADPHDGARNSYALAFPEALPENSTLLPGLTFVADAFYDYNNLWHGVSAIMPFVRWHAENGCAAPARWALFSRGEVRKEMGGWVRTLAEASMGGEVRVVEAGGRVSCFEEAVVMRRNGGGMSREKREDACEMMRCRARKFCGLGEGRRRRTSGEIGMTMLFRTGSRSFKNETAVAGVFERECRKVEGCRVRLARPSNLSFCDQVKLMGETDILVSPHGAQMTNMIFMEKNSSIMEFFPKGWLELAGAGQYVFQWLADWAGMRHQGQWRDPDGETCPFPDNNDGCFTFYKDGRIGHDGNFFSGWAARVLRETRGRKLQDASQRNSCSSCG